MLIDGVLNDGRIDRAINRSDRATRYARYLTRETLQRRETPKAGAAREEQRQRRRSDTRGQGVGGGGGGAGGMSLAAAA